MNRNTSPRPTRPATRLFASDSSPSVAPTVRSWIRSMGMGRRPDSSSSDRSVTRSKVKRRLSIYAAPPVIGRLAPEENSSSSSRNMATWLPVPATRVVSSPNFRVPSALNSMLTIGSPDVWCWPA